MALTIAAICLLFVAIPHHMVHGEHDAVNGDLRLVNGPSVNEGRIEVYYNRQWGTICDDSWNKRDGDVLCKQLGYVDAEYVRFRAYYGEGTGPIWIDQIQCDNGDQSVIDCRHNGWGKHDCKHREDAGVKCRRKTAVKPPSLPVRLSCPANSECGSCNLCPSKKFPDPTDCLPKNAAEGIVEVFYNNVWRPVSDDGWDLNSAHVVCGELGYPLAVAIPTLEELWCNWNNSECLTGSATLLGSGLDKDCNSDVEMRKRLSSTWIKTLECNGKEPRLVDCYFSEFGPLANPSGNVATVRCGYAPHQDCNIRNKTIELYRTRGTAVPWKGRVEVRVDGEWGTVCDRQWDLLDACVVCRGLGFGTAKRVSFRSNYGRGAGKIHYSYLKCDGSETALAQCNGRTGYQAQSCGHGADVGLECNKPERKDTCNEVKEYFQGSRIVQQPETNGYISNFAEIYDDSKGWGLLCYETLDMMSARVICRESSNNFAARIRKGDHPDFRRKRYTWSLVCTGDEARLQDCNRSLVTVSKCQQGEGIIDCTDALPDLVPDLEAFQRSLTYYPWADRLPLYYLGCAHEENCLSSSADGKSYNNLRRLLRFSSQTMNHGTADFRPVLDPSEWIWHSCHAHYHSFEAFIHYDLIDPRTGKKVAEGHKASFCLEDSLCTVGSPRYRCSTGNQGISVNCGDLYARHLDCQWIDISDVPPGTYILRQSLNPDKLTAETDYRNNVVECTLTYHSGLHLVLQEDSCKLSDH